MSYHEGSNWQAKKEDEGKPLYDNKPKAEPTPVKGDADPFIEKHLAIIRGKMMDNIIEFNIAKKMFGGLEMASVQHFLETGTISGSLYLRIKEAMEWAYKYKGEPQAAPKGDVKSKEDGVTEHKKRLSILEKHLGGMFYRTGESHNSISNAMEEYANQRGFTLEDMFHCWNAGCELTDRKQYFKDKFNIDIEHREITNYNDVE